MSSDITNEGQSLIAGTTLRIVTAWKIIRTDGVVYRLIDHPAPLVLWDNALWTPIDGIETGAARRQARLRENDFEVLGIISTSLITDDDLHAGLFSDAKIFEYGVDWLYPEADPLYTRVYWLDDPSFNESFWKANVTGISRFLHRMVGRKFSRTCDAVLGDTRCGVDVAGSYTTTGVVVTLTDNREFITDLTETTDQYHRFGTITWTSGNNDGMVHDIEGYDGTTKAVTLRKPTPFDVQIGDTFSITAGCDNTFATCGTKFSNTVNFRGFPTMPGNENIRKTP